MLKNRPYIYIKFITTMKKLLFFLIIFASCNGGGSKTNTIAKLTAEEFQFEEFLNSDFNYEYLVDQTKKHFKERSLIVHSDTIKALLAANEIEEAEKMASGFSQAVSSSIEFDSFVRSTAQIRREKKEKR